jgi:5'-3' exonuclease
MYKFAVLKGGSITDHFRTMVTSFRNKEVTPFFVFDGKPPPEKFEVLQERSREKEKAEKEYKELEKQLEVMGEGISDKETKEIKKQMDDLKASFIRIKKSDFVDVKKLFDEMEVQYYESPGESDMVLAYLVEAGKAYAVLSDDMDFFLYGVDQVLRQYNLERNSMVSYNTNLILKELNVTLDEFREVSVLAGTDYNARGDIDLKETWDFMFKYKDIKGNKPSFYEWLKENNLIVNINFEKLNKIIKSFNVKTNTYFIENKREIEAIKVLNEFQGKKWARGAAVEKPWARGQKV